MTETKIKITYSKLQEDIAELAAKIQDSGKKYDAVYAVPRGGVPMGVLISHHLNIPIVEEPTDDLHCLIVDDLIDSGKTLSQYPYNDTAVLYTKPHSPSVTYSVEEIDGWVEFPYEATNTDVEDNFRRILEYLGENPNREGLKETPKRYIKFMKEFLHKEDFNFTTFTNEDGNDEMIIQKDIPFFSMCEHHTAPFFGLATVAYIPNGKIVGLSKLARTVKYYASNFQNQERITSQVAERLQQELNPQGVAVTLSARHFCMEMRGVKTSGAHTVTTKLIGAFKEDDKARAEYMAHVRNL